MSEPSSSEKSSQNETASGENESRSADKGVPTSKSIANPASGSSTAIPSLKQSHETNTAGVKRNESAIASSSMSSSSRSAEIPSNYGLSNREIQPDTGADVASWKRLRMDPYFSVSQGYQNSFQLSGDELRRQQEEAEIERMLTGNGLGLGLGGGFTAHMGLGDPIPSSSMAYNIPPGAGVASELMGTNPLRSPLSHMSPTYWGGMGSSVNMGLHGGGYPVNAYTSGGGILPPSASAMMATNHPANMMHSQATSSVPTREHAPRIAMPHLPHPTQENPTPRGSGTNTLPPGTHQTVAGIHCPMYLSRSRTGYGNQKETRRRCKVCRTRIAMICKQCDVALCFATSPTEYSCWEKYHVATNGGGGEAASYPDINEHAAMLLHHRHLQQQGAYAMPPHAYAYPGPGGAYPTAGYPPQQGYPHPSQFDSHN